MHVQYVATLTIAALTTTTHAQTWDNSLGGDWSDPLNWSPTIVPDMPGESATIGVSGAYTVTLDQSVTIDTLSITNLTATLNMRGLFTLALDGPSHVNDGLIVVNSNNSTSTALIHFLSSTTLNGAGVVDLNDPGPDAQISSAPGAVLTTVPTQTLRGTGEIRAALTNNGTVAADRLGLELTLLTEPKTNNELFQATSGGVLRAESITISQSPAGRILGDASPLEFHATTIAGGIIDLNNATLLTSGSGSVTGTSLEFNAGSLVTCQGDLTLSSITCAPCGADWDLRSGATLTTDTPTLPNNGIITVNSNNGSASSTLVANSDLLLNGSGAVVLNDPGNDAQLLTGAGATVTNGPSHTISGTGEIRASLINNGLVEADRPALLLDLMVNDKTNNGVIGAINGSRLNIEGITINQDPGATIALDAGTCEFRGFTAVSNGSLTAINGGLFEIFTNSLTATDVNLSAPLDILGGASLQVAGSGIANNGTITINSNGSPSTASLLFTATSNVSGIGTVLLGDPGNDAQINTGAGVTVTFGAGQIVHGTGHLNADLVNEGVISADEPGASLDVRTNTKTNRNTIEAVAGGILTIDSTTVTQDSGAIIRADGSSIEIQSATITDGELELAASDLSLAGTVQLDGVELDLDSLSSVLLESTATATLTNVNCIDCSADWNLLGGSDLVINTAVLVNNGTVTINSNNSSSTATLVFDSSCSLSGTGSIVLNDPGVDAQLSTNPGATLTTAPGQTIRGTGHLNAALVNNGVVSADISGERLVLRDEDKTNNASIQAVSGAEMEISGVTVTQDPAADITADASTIFLAGTTTVDGGSLTAVNSGSFEGQATLTLRNVTLSGPLNLPNGGDLLVEGSGLTNNGVITVNSNNSSASSDLIFNDTGLLGGTGQVILNDPGNDSRLDTAAGMTVTNGPAHTVSGIGELNADIINQGMIAPGLSVGALEMNGTATNETSGTFVIEIAGTLPGEFDTINGNADFILNGGTVDVTLLGGFEPLESDSWVIITGNSVTGVFDTVTADETLPLGLAYDLSYDTTSVTLSIVCGGADFNDDGLLNTSDFIAFLNAFVAMDPSTDFAPPSGVINTSDFIAFLNLYNADCL